MDINKVSQSIKSQTPDFIESEYTLFNKFIEYYYKSQEKTGLGQNILNNFLGYLDIDKLDIGILDGKTVLVEDLSADSDTIVVENIEPFLEQNGSILIGDEVIYYENSVSSPNIALSPGISYEQVKQKWIDLFSPIDSFDGAATRFPLISQNSPVAPPSEQHLIVKVYGEVLIPGTDYTIDGTDIIFTTAPRTKLPADDTTATSITYLKGFIENSIVSLDNLSNSFGEGQTEFSMTRNGVKYEPITDEYLIAIYDNRLMQPRVDYYIDKDIFIFENAPLNGRFLALYSIEAPIPSFGSDAVGFSRVNDQGQITSVSSSVSGSGYRFEYPPKVTVNSISGQGASVSALINGIKTVSLLSGGRGYSDTNPPAVVLESPTKEGSIAPKLSAKVTNGEVTSIDIIESGSGYTFTPRLTFRQPGGAKLAPPTIVSGQISGTIQVTDAGFGYTTVPKVYVDEPTGVNGIRASLQAVLNNDGQVVSINILNPGQGYETVPRISIIDPVGAQVLDVVVDGSGRVIEIELLDGGSGYDDVPSVYIVDSRTDAQGNYSGGTGATATASIFNGRITDINITNFGSGYSQDSPPQIVIQKAPEASASVEIGLNEVTGFSVSKSGSGYSKAKFTGCARAASGITNYTEDGNAVFSNNTTALTYASGKEVKCLDALFVKRLLDKYIEQFLPDVPQLDYSKIDVRTSIKTIKDFYGSKGTSFSIAYLFKLLYGETVSIAYPKDQIIKPSAATWSIDTILRATLVSGDPANIKDGLLTQELDIADPNIKEASALIENFLSIKTSDVEIFELVLSEETITGTFTVPYKTRLAEPLDTTESIITVDSTIGWPERNGEFLIGNSEVVRYKEKSLNQFIECTRSSNGVVEDWDSATEVTSNFRVYVNKGTSQEVVLNVVGIVDAQQTVLTDTGSYYLPGDKLTVSKLGGTGETPELKTWLYNVKKLIEVSGITFGGIDNRSATVTCSNPHGLLVGDQVTVYGANPIIYNGTFLVTSRDSETVFQYELPQPALVVPQGNILVSVDLNKGKSDSIAINNTISPYTTNIQNTFFNTDYVYVASTGIPNYKIGPFAGSALLPGNQRKLNRFPLAPVTISTKNEIAPGPVGTWINGVSVWSYKSKNKKTFGAVTKINITNAGQDYDAASPPVLTIANGGGTGATANVTVNGSVSEITVTNGGSGYTSSPLVSIVGGGGAGAAATAIVTKGVVSRILINNGGSGYTSQPSITIVGGGGQGATGTASVRGPIQSATITSGGSSYTSRPDVTLSSGSGAVAQAIVNDGRIISIAIISAGQGYTTAPEVTIQGDGFGAVARATIDVDGENAGRVTGIEIINKGIGYVSGTTVINLTSVGQDATFTADVFEWTYNLQETSDFDSAKGTVVEGFNNQYGGEYAHISNPQRLRYILGDNLFENTSNQILEQEDQLEHSPIIGWAFDGNPIYGPYGYSDPTNQSSSIARLNTSYRLKTNLVYNEITNPYPVRTAGPLLTDEEAGRFVEDYEFVFSLGDLDQYNGRFCKTPDFPEGRYCYFVTIDATENGNPLFPYVLGPSFNSVVDKWNLNSDAVQQNIPTGVVRYRDPYENVDIDVDRAPNVSTNGLTTEEGDLLLFEVEDENRDGIIDQAELDDPDQIFEESPLQLFDYFPKVKTDSKVDIEVETITKFEDASVSGFTIENPGSSYQVNDRLIFNNDETGGDGVSARISRIKGETVESYTYENVGDQTNGVLTTTTPHNLQVGDSIFVDYSPIMDNTNKTFVVRQYRGIEEIIINQTGSGYNSDIPPTITIDGDGDSGSLEAIVTSVGSIETVNILNSGSGYTSNPRVILSHPQVFKKADYYVSLIENNEYVKINDVFVNSNKESFICGKTLDSDGNTVGFIAKLSATGVKEWEKTLELESPQNYVEFLKIVVDGSDVWAAGINKPNSVILNNYNPDIILVKYEQTSNGLDASLSFQKGYSGISGSTRADNLTSLIKYSDTRFVIGGYTNTNSANPQDAFIATIDTSGNFALKRKFSSETKSEKLTDMVLLNGDIYFTLETASSASSNDINVSFGKATVGVNSIDVSFINEISNVLYSFQDASICVDEFNEFYITTTLRTKTDHTTKDSIWIGKYDIDGDAIWNYRYVAPGRDVVAVPNCEIDIFGDLNIAFSRTNNTTTEKTVDTLKIKYDGTILNHTTNKFNKNRIEGITAHALDIDDSGDVYAYGQTSWNRNEFIFDFAQTDTATDTNGNYTPTLIGNDATDALVLSGDGVCKLFAKDVANPSNWTNAAIKFTAAELGTKLNDNWTLEFMLYKDATNSNLFSQTQQTLVSIGDASDTTGGLWLYYDISSGELQLAVENNTTAINNAASVLQSAQTTMFADDSWQFVALRKTGDTFTVFINGVQVLNGSTEDTSLGNKDLLIGQISGRNGTAGSYRSNEQGQYYVDNLRLRNRSVTPTVPSDVTTIPPGNTFALAYDWTDDAWFTTFLNQYDYIDYVGWGIKVDKNADAVRLGDKGLQSNTGVGFVRTAVTPVTGSALTLNTIGYDLGNAGIQTLDFDDATINLTENTESLTYNRDVWSSRTATVPSPGSQKLKVTAVVKDKYFFKVTDTNKIDNVQKLTINQDFRFTVGAKLVLNNGSFVNSGYIIKIDDENNYVYTAINNNAWTNDLNLGQLSTEQFNEQSSFGIVGPIPNDINVINSYSFAQVNNTTPGTFDIDLGDYNLDGTESAGSGNLDTFAKFKPFATDDYSIRIDEVSGSSAFIVGSVVQISSGDISFNSEYSTAQITNLTGVLKITLVANLDKVLRVTAVENSDEVYVITSSRHYLSSGDMLHIDGNPSEEVGGVVYDEYDGSFPVATVVSPLEFTYKLPQAAITSPATTAGNVNIFVKSPVLKMYYGHQYLFDLSHSSMFGGNLSFSKDNLYKLEYSFNSIERIGTPGVTGEGQPTPTVKLKVDGDVVTNISYYFDPSRPDAADSPVDPNSYLDVTFSPYLGTFEVSAVTGATITVGADTIKFPLLNEPEGDAEVSRTTYSTSSPRAVGAISDIRIVNPGGFYQKLPIVTGIQSTRQIERVQINEPGTEYAVGEYTGVPIGGDGEGGLVSITVADGTDDEGVTIPGQIQNIQVTSPGKGYTTATIDIEAVDGILGPGLTGSGADVEVVIPPFGTGASIFTKGDKIGKIKKLKNNNFGYDYPHDYTLRPEITFPINAQLTSTSILSSITITDPGSGYSQAPAVVISGGGGTGAIAEATIKNGRLDNIIVKDPGAGYSFTPTVSLRSSFNYVINLDLGLLQFAFPHGIQNGAEVTLNVVDTGEGADFPVSSGATGRLNGSTTYYAIAGSANSLEDDQLKLAITAANAELGDALTFTNAGEGRQQILTESFGGAATANVTTSTFLEGELVYQGDSFETATATGYVSTNSGWQVGPRLLKIVDYTGEFSLNQSVTGVISKSSGIISDLKIAKGVLEIGSITKTTGQFIDDVGKPSEIIQKVQDSYYYQDFSYAVKSAVSINEWKDILIKNVHPASFKVFGELNISDYGSIPNKETAFELTKSVELTRESVVPNIQNFTLVEPVYSEFNNTEVLFRNKRLTSSENILTSVVQRLDDISGLFDGERISFPLTVDGNNVVSNANQLMIILNGVVQTPDTSFEIQGDSIVFSEPPQPPASVKYVNVTIETKQQVTAVFTNSSGIFPELGNTLVGSESGARMTVISVNTVAQKITGFITQGSFINNELVTVGATGYAANIQEIVTFTFTPAATNPGIYPGSSQIDATIVGASGATARIVGVSGNNIHTVVTSGTFGASESVTIAATANPVYAGFSGAISTTTSDTKFNVSNIGLFEFGEQIQNLSGDIATVEQINLATGQETPLGDLRYTVGPSTNQFEVVTTTSGADAPVPEGTFEVNSKYQFGSEIFLVTAVVTGTESTTLTVTRGQDGTLAVSHLEDTPIYGTDIEVTNKLTLSKTAGTYQSKPGLFNIQLNDIIVGAKSGVVSQITSTSTYQDPVTQEFIGQVDISSGSTFFGLLFNRIASTTYANVVLDDISKSQVSIVDFDDNTTAYDARFPNNELINNYVIPYDNATGDFTEGESIRNYKLEYGNNVGDFNTESAVVRKLTLKNRVGQGFFQSGQVIRTRDTKAQVVGYNQASSTLYLGKIGRSQTSGKDYHTAVFSGDAQLDTSEKRYGSSSLLLDGTGDYATVATSTEFGFGTSAFTLECWVRPTTVTGSQYIIDLRSGASDLAPTLYINGAELRFSTQGADRITGGTLTANTWHHVAIARNGTVTKLFLDGTQVGSDFTPDNSDYGSTRSVTIGSDHANANLFTGHIDEVRVSDNARYTANFSAPAGVFQGDTNTKLLLHLDGADGQTYTDDWSGGESLTSGEEFSNDALLETSRITGTPGGFTGNSHRYYDAANLILNNKDFVAKEVVYLLTQQYPSLTLSSGNSEQDYKDFLDVLVEDLRNGSNNHVWDESASFVNRTANPVTLNLVANDATETIWAYNKVDEMLQYIINNVAWTVQGNHGLTQTLDADIIYEGGSANINNCADVYTTINNLVDILTDTLSEADTPTNTADGDHLATVTKVTPAYEYLGATIDAYLEVPYNIDYTNSVNEVNYTNQIDTDSRYRYRDAADLIRLNRGAIVDKASADLLSRYPDLNLDMPRNASNDASGTNRCKTDLGLILDGIANDIENGGNKNTVTAAKFYLGNNDVVLHIRLQIWQSAYAHERLGYYAKQAITGDLDNTNTENIIYGDWGITNDPGNCANVQTAIDTLIDTLNDIISPVNDEYRVAADRLYFNREYITAEVQGYVQAQFTYDIGATYQAITYANQLNPEDLIIALISDLQTGGNNSGIGELETYLTATLAPTGIDTVFPAAILAFDKIKELGAAAIRNELYDQFATVTGTQYAAVYTGISAYRDDETPSNISTVESRFNTLIETLKDSICPGDTEARSAVKQMLFNANYYKNEIEASINNQFGVDSWQYDDFVDEVIADIDHDLLITDTTDTISASEIPVTSVTGTFTVGETVTSSGTGTAEILEYDSDNNRIFIGPVTGTAWAGGDTLTGANGGTATINSGTVSALNWNPYDGQADYFYMTNQSAEMQMGTGPITLECWVYLDSSNTGLHITGSDFGNFNWFISRYNIGFWGGNYSNYRNISQTFQLNTWYHVAVTRSGAGFNQAAIYVNGVRRTTFTWGTNYASPMRLIVGRNSLTGGSYFRGYISGLRVISGQNLYTTNTFTLPTEPATAVPGTVFLTAVGAGATDSSAYAAPMTVVGTINEQNSIVPPVTAALPAAFDWYQNPSNVKLLSSLASITSNVEGILSGTNLFTNPEDANAGWSAESNYVSFVSDIEVAPDKTLTAEKIRPAVATSTHYIRREYNIDAFSTFDDSTIRFDSTNSTFDEGSPSADETQQFTFSIFIKAGELDQGRIYFFLDKGVGQTYTFFEFDLGAADPVGSLFNANTFTGTVDAYGLIPFGNGWYRAYITCTFGFGYSEIGPELLMKNSSGSVFYTGNNSDGMYVWGAKLNKGPLDPYTAVSGQIFYSDQEFNIKNTALDILSGYLRESLTGDLDNPSILTSTNTFYENAIASDYDANTIHAFVRGHIGNFKSQLSNSSHYTSITSANAITVPTKTYGTRTIPVGISGGIFQADFTYGLSSDAYAEIESVTENSGLVVKVYSRFRIDGDITDGPFTMNETVSKQGAPSITGVVYGFYEDENAKYLDVEVTAGPWAITDTIIGAENSTSAQISAIETRLHVIDLKGDFVEDIPFKGYTSGYSATPTGFNKIQAAVLDNTGGTLTVDTESLQGVFETTSVVYPETSREYIEVSQFAGLDIAVGDQIASVGYTRFGVSVPDENIANFTVGNILYKLNNNIQDLNTTARITGVDLDNNYIYATVVSGTFANGDTIADYGLNNPDPLGRAIIGTTVVVAGAAAARVQDVRVVGLNRRLYLSNIRGTFTENDAIVGPFNTLLGASKAVILSKDILKARVKRAFRGFDGTQTNFKLTTENGTQYLPDPAGHMLIFVNGILQPPGATNAYTAFSDEIQFTEAPELGASFTGFYVGKLRQLDDISFEFDSLRQSFNLKRNEVFYSLTLTEGVQSSTIRPENNIIVSLNGVIQEPGVGFEIVGSRIIFSEIPRFGSTFVAFSYVGSEADVDAAEVVPPIEPGDFIDIQGETTDREVAVIESSNSLITFDYLGSIFGNGAIGSAQLTTGFIDKVQVTSGGSGYTSRPTVRIDSISGFDGNVKALVGVSGVELQSIGSGYSNPEVLVETVVPDDWTAPNLADYGEELVDPEII